VPNPPSLNLPLWPFCPSHSDPSFPSVCPPRHHEHPPPDRSQNFGEITTPTLSSNSHLLSATVLLSPLPILPISRRFIINFF
jgi:hypothetical protein